jgi:hypothetical protein
MLPAFSRFPSKLAQRYGVYPGTDPLTNPKIPHRSALTPVDTLFPVYPGTLSDQQKAERALDERIEKIQRDELFWGFTSREFVDLDVFTFRKLKGRNLTNGIVPLLRMENWEKVVSPDWERDYLYPLDKNNPGMGNWIASNDIVYEQLRPCLQIASRILASMYLLPWVRYFRPSLNLVAHKYSLMLSSKGNCEE